MVRYSPSELTLEAGGGPGRLKAIARGVPEKDLQQDATRATEMVRWGEHGTIPAQGTNCHTLKGVFGMMGTRLKGA